MRAKLMVLSLLSTVFIGGAVGTAAAHEVLPTIADLRVVDNEALQIDFRINLEAFLAGIDLDTVDDTDADAAGAEYDTLRALPADEVAARAGEIVAAWSTHPLITADGPVALSLAQVTMPDDLDFELPRISDMRVVAVLPQNTRAVAVHWPEGAGALALRQQDVSEPYTGLLTGGASSPAINLFGADAAAAWPVFASYVPVGLDHILPKGLDHILFILGFFFLSTRLAPLLWQVGAFTLAHSVTLAVGALGWVNHPGSVIELLVAVSIVYIAVDNLFRSGLNRWRTLLVFLFGLVHGLGLAAAFGEYGAPPSQFIPALLGFNVGAELGQLTVIGAAALGLWGCTWVARRADLSEVEAPAGRYPVMFRAVSVPASLIIALIGAYWCLERAPF